MTISTNMHSIFDSLVWNSRDRGLSYTYRPLLMEPAMAPESPVHNEIMLTFVAHCNVTTTTKYCTTSIFQYVLGHGLLMMDTIRLTV